MNPELDTFDCKVTLPDWRLHLASLARKEGRDLGNVMDVATRGARAHLLRHYPDSQLLSHPTVAAIRECLRNQGHDPDRTPPCSELLLRRFLAAEEIPRGCLAWEFLAVLTVKSGAPWAVLDRDRLEPPLVFRRGEDGETLRLADRDFPCSGLPVLADRRGVQASPWTYGEPRDLAEATTAVFVCFLPPDLFRQVDPKSHVGRLIWLTWAYSFVFERTCTFNPD